MSVLFVNQFFGPDTAATGQLLTDVASGVDPGTGPVTVLCGRIRYGTLDERPAPSVTLIRCGSTRFSRRSMYRLASYASFLGGATREAFRAPRAGVVVSLTTPPLTCMLGAVLQMARGSRHYIWEMDVYPDIAIDLKVLKRHGFLARAIGGAADWSRKKADGIIVLGEDMKARLVARGIPEHKIHIAENWADGSEITPMPFPAGPLVIHYSGNLGLAHDIETMIGALTQFASDRRFRFVFAGDGARRSRLENFCHEQNIETVSFQPYSNRADLGKNLATGHLGLVTQLPETCGSVVPSKTYGIMAAGRPILYIGPRDGTPARIIEQHRCGWQIDPGDVSALIGLLERLSEDRTQIHEAGARARQAFEQNYDRPIGVARIASILGLSTAAPLSPECSPGDPQPVVASVLG